MQATDTAFDRHNLIEKDAAEFAGRILGRVRDALPYGNIRFDTGAGDYKPSPSMAFRRLGAISTHIQSREVHPDACFPDKIFSEFFTAFNHAVGRPERDVLGSGIRNGIIEFIWRAHECITFVSEKSPTELERYLTGVRVEHEGQSSLRGSRGRATTQARTWDTDVREWREVVQRWTEYLALFDSVFPRVFWDIEGATLLIAQRYPRLFWEEFWALMASQSRFTEFQQFMVHTITPQVTVMGHTTRALQGRLNRSADGFAPLMARSGMNEGLIATGITLYPRSEDLSAETRDFMEVEADNRSKKTYLPQPSGKN